jgi:hypothetical protein
MIQPISPLTGSEIEEEIRRVKEIQSKAKMDDLIRKAILRDKRNLSKVGNQLNTYKTTNLLDPWVNKRPFK